MRKLAAQGSLLSQQQQWCRPPAACRHKATHKRHGSVGFQCSSNLAGQFSRAAVAAALQGVAAAAADVSSRPREHNSNASEDWRSFLCTKALESGQLVKLTMKARIKGDAGLVNVKAATGDAAAARAGSASEAADLPQGAMPYKQLTMRPVLIKGKRMLQVSLLTARQDITKNFTESQAPTELAQLLQLPWQSAHLLTLTESVTVQVSKKGKALVKTSSVKTSQQQQVHNGSSAGAGSSGSNGNSQSMPQQQVQQQVLQVPELFGSTQQEQQQQQQVLINLQHDRVKATPINGNVPDPFLHKIGLQTAEGRIKANMQAKFTQINEFLKLLSHSGVLDQLGHTDTPDSSSSSSSSGGVGTPIHILDAGCGSSHLTFGTFHFLHNIRGLPVRLTGVDTNRALMERSNRACAGLGIADVAHFYTAAIKDFPGLGLPAPNMVLALHACDTATDESLAVGVSTAAQVIMSVPCCQKDIQRQFQRQQHSRSKAPGQQQVQQVFEPLLDHGILKQRQLDLLTDTFRAQLLRLAGYRTDVVEFVSTEHTPRNLLIRAVRQRKPQPAADLDRLAVQYKSLRDAWGVRPHLERLLLDSLPLQVASMLKDKQC